MPPGVQWRNREKRNYQEHERQAFFIQLSVKIGFVFFIFLYFLKKRPIHFLCSLLLLFVPVGKRLNSRSQLFYEIDAFKNLTIFTGKKLQEIQHRCFPVNIAKCLSTAFYIEHLFIILFRNFM